VKFQTKFELKKIDLAVSKAMFWMNIVSVVIEKTEIYCATSRKSLIPVYSASNSNSLASLIYIHHDFFGQIQKKKHYSTVLDLSSRSFGDFSKS
jgi:hypothetical protein